jgi:hypothetical protein
MLRVDSVSLVYGVMSLAAAVLSMLQLYVYPKRSQVLLFQND